MKAREKETEILRADRRQPLEKTAKKREIAV